MLFRLYSDYPFRSRKDGGPRDDFERDRAGRPEAQPRHPVLPLRGLPATAPRCGMRRRGGCRPIASAATTTTRTAPSGTGRSGDVGGVLEIIRPLDRDIARTREGLRGTFVLMAVVSGALLALSGLVLVVRSRRLE